MKYLITIVSLLLFWGCGVANAENLLEIADERTLNQPLSQPYVTRLDLDSIKQEGDKLTFVYYSEPSIPATKKNLESYFGVKGIKQAKYDIEIRVNDNKYKILRTVLLDAQGKVLLDDKNSSEFYEITEGSGIELCFHKITGGAGIRTAGENTNVAMSPENAFAQGQKYYNEKNYISALPYLETATKSEPVAYAMLGDIYSIGGGGVTQDKQKAYKYYVQGYKAGDKYYSAYAMGHMLTFGLGVPRNFETGKKYLKQAADAGHPYACRSLGMAYFAGDTEKNRKGKSSKLAEKYLGMAIENGDTDQNTLTLYNAAAEAVDKAELERKAFWNNPIKGLNEALEEINRH